MPIDKNRKSALAYLGVVAAIAGAIYVFSAEDWSAPEGASPVTLPSASALERPSFERAANPSEVTSPSRPEGNSNAGTADMNSANPTNSEVGRGSAQTLDNTVRISAGNLPSEQFRGGARTPSIGTVRVLGHRGCDVNTQGWFLSVGTPEQYDFKVSEDGETIEVKSNVDKPTGNFEFVQCVNAGEVAGRRVRFTARVKAQNVSELAQIRFRGEDRDRRRITYRDLKVGGSHGWQDYSLDVEVSPEVALFSFGLTYRSTGKIWMSRPEFAILP